jgi:hypothetical protein
MKTLQVLCLLLLVTGCAGSFAGRAPETRTLVLPHGQEFAYQRAAQVLTQMGAQMTAMDGPRALQGLVHGVVILSIQLQQQPGGTLVVVTGSIPPGKLVVGSFTEVDDFCARLVALETAHAR